MTYTRREEEKPMLHAKSVSHKPVLHVNSAGWKPVFYSKSAGWKLMTGIWLFVMMALPDTSSRIKIGLLLLLVCHALYRGGLCFPRRFLLVVIVWEVLFGLFYLNALASRFAFSFPLAEIYLLRPFFLLILCSYCGTEEMMRTIRQQLLWITLFIEGYNLILILQAFGVMPVLIREQSSAALTIVNSDFLTIRSANQTALIFLIPYVMELFFHREVFGKKEKRLITVLCFLGLFVAVLSGRRILQILSMMVFLTGWIRSLKRRVTAGRFVRGMAALLIAGSVVVFFAVMFWKEFQMNVFSLIQKTIHEAFDQSGGGWQLRYRQLQLLVRDWLKRPFWGWGLSAYDADYYVYKFSRFGVPAAQDLWSFEFFYIALLFQTGLAGVTFAGVLVYRVIKKIVLFFTSCTDGQMAAGVRAVLCGTAAFFIAGFTNPMITSIWFWYLLLGTYVFTLKASSVPVVKQERIK